MSFAVIPSEEISHRTDFSILCNARGYRDAVEVGVDQAVFAVDFLRRFKGNWLYLIDPYAPHAEFPIDRTGDLLTAAVALAPFHGRYRIVRGPSPEVVPWVCSLVAPEFVYVDGAHDREAVARDLVAWWERIPPGGMLAGHDFDAGHPGVVSAVEAFARAWGLVVRLTHETDAPPSWYVYKGEPPTLMHRMFKAGESANPHAKKGGG